MHRLLFDPGTHNSARHRPPARGGNLRARGLGQAKGVTKSRIPDRDDTKARNCQPNPKNPMRIKILAASVGDRDVRRGSAALQRTDDPGVKCMRTLFVSWVVFDVALRTFSRRSSQQARQCG
jgi:hypothetical protein